MKTLHALCGLALVVLLAVCNQSWRGRAGSNADAPLEVSGAIRLANGERPPGETRVFMHPIAGQQFEEATDLAPTGSIPVVVEEGSYRATLPSGGVFAMSVSAPGWTPYSTQLEIRKDTRHDVKLSADGFSFTLDLEDVAHVAIREAEVSVYAHDGQHLSRRHADSHGRVSFSLLGGQYRFVFRAPGFVPHARNILVLANEHRSLTLSRAATLYVKVGSSGAAAPELAVVDGLGRLAASGRSTDGMAHFEALHEGRYLVWAGRAGREASATVLLTAGQSTSVELTLKEQAPVSVPLPARCDPRLAMDAPTHDGRSAHYRLPFEVRDAGGRRSLTLNKPPLDLRASLRCDDRIALISLPRGGGVESELEWRRAREVRGRVLAPDGRGLQGAVISVTPQPGASGAAARQLTTISRADGSFSVGDVPEGEVALMAAHPRHGRASQPLIVAASSPGQELRFRADYYLAGKVVDVGGAPVARATVAFASPVGGNASQTSDAEGAFRIGPLGADEGLLFAFVDGRLAHDKPLLVSAENRDHLALVLDRSRVVPEKRRY